jgi:hypothetical protein
MCVCVCERERERERERYFIKFNLHRKESTLRLLYKDISVTTVYKSDHFFIVKII